MRTELGPFAVDILLSLAGLGILLAIRAVPWRASEMIAALGLAYLTGASVVPLALIALLVIGVPLTLATFLAVALLCMGIGGLRFRSRIENRNSPRQAWWQRPWRSWPADVWVTGAFVVLFGAFAVVGMLSALEMPLTGWDAWTIWARKAQMLTVHDSLVRGFFAAPSYGFTHLDYPLQLPVWEALHFRAAGAFDTHALLRHVWLLLVAFVWAAAYLLRKDVRPIVWAPLLLLAASAPGVWQQLLTGYADVPMAIFAGIGAISLALWLSRGEGATLALAAIMLAAAANTKNEGLMIAVALLLVAGSFALIRAHRIRQFVLASGFVLAAVLPWRFWIDANGIQGDLPISQGLDPGYLFDRTERVWPAIQAISNQLADQGQWLYLLPLAALMVTVSLASGIGRRVAGFYLGTFVLCWAGIVWSYWISPHPLGWHLSTSVNRVISALMFIGIAAVLHLSGLLSSALNQQRDRIDEAVGTDSARSMEMVPPSE